MPVWATRPAQECHRSVLLVGTTGPASRPVAGVVPGPVVGPVFSGARVVDAGEVQAVTVISAATATVSAAALPRTARPPRRGIDMSPIMPDAFGSLVRPRRNQSLRAAVTPRRGDAPRAPCGTR